jgi:hypothetical protein
LPIRWRCRAAAGLNAGAMINADLINAMINADLIKKSLARMAFAKIKDSG